MKSLTSKFWLAGLTALILLAPAWNALAQDAPTTDYKIGVVDRKFIFDNFSKQKAQYAQLEKERETRQTNIDAEGDKLEARRKDLIARQESMSDEQKQQAETEFQSDLKEYRRKLDDLQAEIDRMATQHFKTMIEEIGAGIVEVANAENYHLVLEASSDPKVPSSVLYHSKTIDITEKVLLHLEAKYKSGK